MNQKPETNEEAEQKEALKELIRFAELRIKELQNAIHLVDRYRLLYILTAFALIGFFMERKNLGDAFVSNVFYLAIIAMFLFYGVIKTEVFNAHKEFIEKIDTRNLSVMEIQEKILNVYVREMSRLEDVRKDKISDMKIFMFILAFFLGIAYLYTFLR